MSKVKIISGPVGKGPAPQNYADIKGQGKIPYGKITEEKTPNTAKGIMVNVKWLLKDVMLFQILNVRL